jgi:diadenosine tetraphosphatase ApaH/serine/threonine PP2A family protein phosphatase
LSDIHGSLDALTACLRRARDRGAESFVGYGADARAVVEVVARYAAQGSVVLRGNHDEAVEKSGGYFNDASRAAIEWARQTLSQEQRRFLAKLPLVARQGTICYAHASAPEHWDYIDSPAAAKRCADAAYTFCGHVHDPGPVFRQRPRPDERVPALPGDRDPGAQSSPLGGNRRFGGSTARSQSSGAYMLFDPERQTLTFLRVPYDAAAAGISSTRRACGIG